jgi:hypothetical protein
MDLGRFLIETHLRSLSTLRRLRLDPAKDYRPMG